MLIQFVPRGFVPSKTASGSFSMGRPQPFPPANVPRATTLPVCTALVTVTKGGANSSAISCAVTLVLTLKTPLVSVER